MIQVGGDTSRALRRWGQHGKGDGAFLGGRKRGQNFCGPPNVPVAILAQGTHWAVAVTQALFVAGSIPTRSAFPLDLPLSEPLLCTTPLVRLTTILKVASALGRAFVPVGVPGAGEAAAPHEVAPARILM